MFLLLPLLTFGLTVLLLRLLLGNGRLLAADIPNHRSLHEGAIPRGGGIAFVISVVIAFGLFYLFSDIIAWWPAALLILLLGSAFLGWLDDHHNLSIIIRLIMQFLLASFAWIFVVHNGSWQTSIAWFPMALIGFVWSMNLVNFMDGMDGLAATQGILGGGALCVWLYLAGANQEVLFMLVWIAGLCAFLIFNWHPARVFMGDTGSLALGAVLATVSLIAITRYDIPSLGICIIFSPFLADSGVTLLRRMIAGEKWWQSHRKHFYQRAVQCGCSQTNVLWVFIGIELVMIALASWILTKPEQLLYGVALALLILLVPAWMVYRMEGETHEK